MRASVYAFSVLQSLFKHVGDISIKTCQPQTDKGIAPEGTPIPTEEEFQKMLRDASSLRDRFLLAFLREIGVRTGRGHLDQAESNRKGRDLFPRLMEYRRLVRHFGLGNVASLLLKRSHVSKATIQAYCKAPSRR